MDVVNFLENVELVKAWEGGRDNGRSNKWREKFCFPNISFCRDLAANMERDYTDLCVEQPIGRKLFELFCQTRVELQNHVAFHHELDQFDKEQDEERRVFGVYIIESFFTDQSSHHIPAMSKHKHTCMEYLASDPNVDVFQTCLEESHAYLSGEPFEQYQRSMYFDRFLQWKMLERRPINKNMFRQYRLLGKGGFGEVWACKVCDTGMMYACKKIEKKLLKKRRCEAMVLNEKQILESVKSRFMVNLAYAYETKHALCLVMTMMSGGDLKFHIHKRGAAGLSEDRVRFYAAEVCCGLMHLHANSILYRDLKPENILLDKDGHIRISDLGLAVWVAKGAQAKGRVGTPGYMAPEVIVHKHYGMSVDWWGLGCLIYEMTSGQKLFRTRGKRISREELERQIQMEQEEYSELFSEAAMDICSQLLTKDPKNRLGCRKAGGREVQSHPFFQEVNFRMLEAGLVTPPFIPDPRLVYCSDVQDIDDFPTVRGVRLDNKDSDFYAKFSTGSVPTAWQNEMIETECFTELNVFGPDGGRPPDLIPISEPTSPTFLTDSSPASPASPVSPMSPTSRFHHIFKKNSAGKDTLKRTHRNKK
ncbi:G protein-coupled receptor kinase 5 [Nerophis lumbriciformis]|uniref:G protein-coupled receptor kinase 5 n=1 Tax=Nerophis lumbriciformis TaxID=546530 RepID=UPI002AE02C9B|nr:G protein-coupled receptor kinase 6-like [Nerophis lumbriciformis]